MRNLLAIFIQNLIYIQNLILMFHSYPFMSTFVIQIEIFLFKIEYNYAL